LALASDHYHWYWEGRSYRRNRVAGTYDRSPCGIKTPVFFLRLKRTGSPAQFRFGMLIFWRSWRKRVKRNYYKKFPRATTTHYYHEMFQLYSFLLLTNEPIRARPTGLTYINGEQRCTPSRHRERVRQSAPAQAGSESRMRRSPAVDPSVREPSRRQAFCTPHQAVSPR